MSKLAISTNTLFGQPLSAEHEQVIANASTTREAVEGLGLTGDLNGDEVERFFAAFPPSVDAAVLAAMQSAAARGVPLLVSWQPAGYFGVSVREAVEGGEGVVVATVESPWVRHLESSLA